jgi:hypothetical protein
MATRALERGGLDRHLVTSAEMLGSDATGVLLGTAAWRHPWPTGPFPSPPDRSRCREGRLRIEAVADTVLRVRYAPGQAVREGGQDMLVGTPPPGWVRVEHGLGTMPLYLREGAVVPMGPVTQWVGERPRGPLTVVVAPFEDEGTTELEVPVDGRQVTIRYQARAGRHLAAVDSHAVRVELDAPPTVELRS